MKKPIRFIVIAGLLFAICVMFPRPSSAGSLSTAIIGMFPKTVGEFAYADMKTARQFSWFPQLREQLLPSKFRQFEQFLTAAGVDPNTQVDELAWGAINAGKAGGEQILGVALGSFDPTSSETRFKQQKLPMTDYHGYHLYAFGSGSGATDILFTFIDANTAAFGVRPAMEKMIDVRTGVTESLLTNDLMFPLINEADGTGVIWAVLDQSYTHIAVQQLLPQAGQFPQAAAIINRMHAMTISVAADSGIDVQFQAVCNSTDDANLLAAALQAGVMYRRYQAAQDHPDLASALDQVRVTPSGDRLKIDAPVSQDQLLSLIRTRAFAVPM
ncbi:MAG TPA: hypothetical protein VMD77_01355 [Candidatus Baltobacteraceae bacterium]|nr:hypothetical protein [Candidatus Baltobacteraceae bacterium]